jgi:hypothetical protein
MMYLYIPVDLLLHHFHHLISLDDYTSCTLVSKEWNIACKLYYKNIMMRHISLLVPQFTPKQINNISLLKDCYRAARCLQKTTTHAGIVPQICTDKFLTIQFMTPREFLAENISNITRKLVKFATFSLEPIDSYICTPNFYALVACTFNKEVPTTSSLKILPVNCFNNAMYKNKKYAVSKEEPQTARVLELCLNCAYRANILIEYLGIWLNVVSYYIDFMRLKYKDCMQQYDTHIDLYNLINTRSLVMAHVSNVSTVSNVR